MKNLFKKIYKIMIINFFLLIYKKIDQKIFLKNANKINFLFRKKKYCFKFFKEVNIRVYTDNLYNVAYIKKSKIITNLSIQFSHKNASYININKNSVFTNGTPSFIKYLPGKTLSLIQGASGKNYFHWLYDILPKIYLLNKKIDINSIDFFYLPNFNSSVMKETLSFFDIEEKKIITSKKFKHVLCDKLYTIQHPYYFAGHWWDSFNNIPLWIIHFLRSSYKKKIPSNQKLKIFLDRTDTTNQHNQIINNEELKVFLISKGYKIIKPSELSFNDQVKIFSQSSKIISPHGAGLANLTFCNKGTKVFDLKSKNFSNNLLYKKISKMLKIKYHDKVLSENNNNKIFVHIPKFEKELLKNKFI